jgi:signal transduction histidine kinase
MAPDAVRRYPHGLLGFAFHPRNPRVALRAASALTLKTWPVVALALGGLLTLVVVSSLATRHKAQEIYRQLDELNMSHRHVEAKLRRLRSDVHLSGIFVRDYLLDNSHLTGPHYRDQLTRLREATIDTTVELSQLIGGREAHRVQNLKVKLEEYWQAFEPLFDWTPVQKSALSSVFLRKQVLPRRDAVLGIAQQIEELNNANMAEQRAQVILRASDLDEYVSRMLWGSIGLGALVAITAVVRIRVLEKRSREQHKAAEQVGQEMRRLSHQLVRAQEEERKRLSRELHDEVGQVLTALRMELSRAERLRMSTDAAFTACLFECKRLSESMVRTVRRLSMGLRPAMLDDLGLGAALSWHARDFLSRYNVPVSISLHGDLDALAEPHRTCVYRVVQEALTNCARHAQAARIEVAVIENGGDLSIEIRDDGVGVQGISREGLGLIGLQERVRELDGRTTLISTAGVGTTLRVEIPHSMRPTEKQIASPVGR